MNEAPGTEQSWRRVVVAGPDLARRAEVAVAVVTAARREFAVVEHVRVPRPRRSGRPRRRLGALLHVLFVALGYWRAQSRRGPPSTGGGGLLVIEGSWFDLLVHPREHGLPTGVIELGRFLALLVPRADLLVTVDSASSPPARPGAVSPDWGRGRGRSTPGGSPARTWRRRAWPTESPT